MYESAQTVSVKTNLSPILWTIQDQQPISHLIRTKSNVTDQAVILHLAFSLLIVFLIQIHLNVSSNIMKDTDILLSISMVNNNMTTKNLT